MDFTSPFPSLLSSFCSIASVGRPKKMMVLLCWRYAFYLVFATGATSGDAIEKKANFVFIRHLIRINQQHLDLINCCPNLSQ